MTLLKKSRVGSVSQILLMVAHALILDRPSTTAVEVAATNVPLFVLMLNDNWFEEPLQLLAKRAVICRSKEELADSNNCLLFRGQVSCKR